VLAVDLDQEQAEQLAADYNGKVAGSGVNVTDYAQVEQMLETAIEHFGTLDVVINNAGIGSAKMLLEHDPKQDFDIVTVVNQKGVYHGILAAGRKFKALGKPGVILNTSSICGQMAAEMRFSYNVSKAAVDMMTKCAALELAPDNIRVAAVAPGRVDTPMLRQYEALGLWEHIRKEQMRAEFTQPGEIADVCAFLASAESNCINGSTVCAEDSFLNFKYPLLTQD
jgi:NAD(P)-dependent dehydrogenase (short-subunit alcohol dehydrogenase family)